jgi:glutamyl-Q tRNA(Asp) synthetase
MDGVITRFAPSPTGRLHLGHAWSAMLAHDLARTAGGQFHLRIEDIDAGRCRADHVQAIYDDLAWLGLHWDSDVVIQSERSAVYEAALARLGEMGLVYRCTCTRAEIAQSAGAPQGDAGPIYPGTCRNAGHPRNDNKPYCWRLDMAKACAVTGSLVWHDANCGVIQAAPQAYGDIVIARKDAATSYHLAVTLDDAAQGVTDVVRGIDLFAVTHIHRLLQALLGLATPRYHHHALVTDGSGIRLAKRNNAPSLASLRENGVDPQPLLKNIRAGRFPIGFMLSAA